MNAEEAPELTQQKGFLGYKNVQLNLIELGAGA